MKADVQYNDFIGTVAADISDALGGPGGDDMETYGKYFKIDEVRFEVLGLSIYGTDHSLVSLICKDKKRSTTNRDYIVKMSVDIEDPSRILKLLFKRIHILLHDKHNESFKHLGYDEEADYDDFHENIQDDNDD